MGAVEAAVVVTPGLCPRAAAKKVRLVPADGPIPAQLLGNIWSQEWNNVYSLMDSPKPLQSYDLTKILRERKTEARGMVKYGEAFFVSLGFAPLPPTFWERSLFTKPEPEDRDVVCHASAWDIDSKEDLRIKMCIQITEEDFRTIHHELGHEPGHNFYQRAYGNQPPLFQNSANDGFHEAVGDTIALSVTPEYLKKIGLIENVPPPSGDIDYLLLQALEKVAFLPFGLLVDKWRWEAFSGRVRKRELPDRSIAARSTEIGPLGKAGPNAFAGAKQTLARGAGNADRTTADGCDRARGLFSAAQDLVG